MAKNGNRKKNEKENLPKLKTETKHGIKAVVFFVFALFFLMSAFNVAGVAGRFTYEKLHYLLGIGYILLPALFILLGSSFINREEPDIGWTRTISGVMFLLSGLGIIDVVSGNHSGGLLGEILSTPFFYLFDFYASIIFLVAILIISILLMFDARPTLMPFFRKIWNFIVGKKDNTNKIEMPKEEDPSSILPLAGEEESEPVTEKIKKALGMNKEEEEEIEFKKLKARSYKLSTNYVPPPLSLLEEDKGKPNTGDVKANSNIIRRTLANFGIEVEMDE